MSESLDALARAVERYDGMRQSEWLADLEPSGRENIHANGRNYDPDLRFVGGLGVEHGGFFYPITTDTRSEALVVLFGEDGAPWLERHLASGGENLFQQFFPPRLTPQQHAFVEAYDAVMASVLDPDFSKDFSAEKWSESLADGTLTDLELRNAIAELGLEGQLEAMGPLANEWFLFTGGVIQGIADFDGGDASRAFLIRRYELDEFVPFYSRDARNAVLRNTEENFNTSDALRGLSTEERFLRSLDVSVAQMVGFCNAAEAPEFVPPAPNARGSQGR